MNEKEKEIEKIIKQFAINYNKFETLQKNNLLANGDQKTGVIGEYYAKVFISEIKGATNVKYSKAGSPYDIVYTDVEGKEIKVQVKTVSYYSKTRTLAPLNMKKNAFDHLYLISLNQKFEMDALYINKYNDIFEKVKMLKRDNKDRITGAKLKGMTYVKTKVSGSGIFDFSLNML